MLAMVPCGRRDRGLLPSLCLFIFSKEGMHFSYDWKSYINFLRKKKKNIGHTFKHIKSRRINGVLQGKNGFSMGFCARAQTGPTEPAPRQRRRARQSPAPACPSD